MPLILQHASFEAPVEGAFGVALVQISVHRTGLERYEADCWIRGASGTSNGDFDATLNRNFESWEEALLKAAKAAVFKVQNTPAKIVGPWKQESSTHFEVDDEGNRIKVKDHGFEHDKHVHDEKLNISLPTSEGKVLPNVLKVKDSAKEGLRRFKSQKRNVTAGKVFDEP